MIALGVVRTALAFARISPLTPTIAARAALFALRSRPVQGGCARVIFSAALYGTNLAFDNFPGFVSYAARNSQAAVGKIADRRPLDLAHSPFREQPKFLIARAISSPARMDDAFSPFPGFLLSCLPEFFLGDWPASLRGMEGVAPRHS